MIMPCGWTTLQYNVVPDEDIKDFEWGDYDIQNCMDQIVISLVGPELLKSICGKDFFDHLEKWKPQLDLTQWEQEENQIMSLMLQSIEPDMGSTLMHLQTAKVIQDSLAHIYGGVQNITRLYTISKQYFGLRREHGAGQPFIHRWWGFWRNETYTSHS